jgi:hypothetical protein
MRFDVLNSICVKVKNLVFFLKIQDYSNLELSVKILLDLLVLKTRTHRIYNLRLIAL